jgi:hypothetical protein
MIAVVTSAVCCVTAFVFGHLTLFIAVFFPPPNGATAPSGPGPPYYRGFTITLSHTTLGRTPLDE